MSDNFHNNKLIAVNNVMKYIKETIDKDQIADVSSLVKENKKILNTKVSAFIHDGFAYRDRDSDIRDERPVALSPELWDRMDSILKASETKHRAAAKARQGLAMASKECTSYQDLRDLFPDCVLPAVPELKEYPRTRPTDWPYPPGSDKYEQWQEAEKNLTFLAVSRMF